MKLLKLYFLTIFTLFANESGMQSVTSGALHELTLKQALHYLKSDNIELKVAALNTKMKDLESSIATGQSFGQLNLQQNIMNSDDAGNVFGFKLASREVVQADFITTTLNNPTDRNFFQTKLSYSLALYTGGKLSAAQSISTALLEISSLEGKALWLKKSYELHKSFYDIQLLNAFINDLEAINLKLQTLHKVTQNMVTEGYAKKIDLLEVQSKQASVTRLLSQSKANKSLALAYVSFLLNKETLSVDVSHLDNLVMNQTAIDVNSLYGVKQAEQGVAISADMLDMSTADYLPMVGAYAELSTASNGLGRDFEKNKAYTVGVQMNWNLFSGLSTWNAHEKAQVALLKAKQQLLLAKRGLALNVKKLQTQVSSLEAELISMKSEITFSLKIVENYHDRYAEKLSSIADVMRAESSHIKKVLEYKKTANEKNDKILQLKMLTQGL